MDDTTQSRVSDVGTSAASRKRRSSILKSQRPARTPFSELEFKVATPTDTAKSRRVSFSRRTGVAEFVTNEATTTWKNFYEEHNKSLESSGNDSSAKQSVGHLGKRIFDQQFEVVDAADFIDSVNPTNGANFDHLITLDSTDKLTAPQNKFELSAFTDQQSKIFGNDFTVPTMGDLSGVIRVNFSNIQPVDSKDYKDDLDEIQKDIQQGPNVVCVGPFTGRPSMSEYIEVDLNTTTVVPNEVCDMSITDTVHSPKVQDVSKSISIDKKNKDWVVDKENIAVNPYAAPRESLNFAINDEPDEVLVFDGKRLTIQLEDPKEKSYRNTSLSENKPPQRKTIVLNMDDDLPNFAEDLIKKNAGLSNSVIGNAKDVSKQDDKYNISLSRSQLNSDGGKRKTIVFDEGADISMTRSVPGQIVVEQRRKTVVYDNEEGNISMTQALPPNILVNEEEKAKTIIFDDQCDISVTQAIPSNILPEKSDKRRTIIFEEDQANISVTQVLPTNIPTEKIVFQKRQTLVFEDNNISITQAIPNNIIMEEKQVKRQTVVFDTESDNLSMTEAISSNFEPEKRKTIVFDDNQGNISITQALPLNIQPNGSEKRRTIIFNENECDISITQAIPNLVIQKSTENQISNDSTDEKQTILSDINREKRHSVYDEDISITQGIPSNIIPEKRKTIVFENDQGDISVTQAIPSNIIQNLTKNLDENMSITEALHIEAKNFQTEEKEVEVAQNNTVSNSTVGIEKDSVNVILFKENCNAQNSSYDSVRISTTQSLPINIKFNDLEENQKPETTENNNLPKDKVVQLEANTVDNVVSINNAPVNENTPTNIEKKTKTDAELIANVNSVHPVTDYLLSNLDSNTDQRVVSIKDIQKKINPNVSLKYEHDKSKPIPVDLIEIQKQLMKPLIKEDPQVNTDAIVFQTKVTLDSDDSSKDVASLSNASTNEITSTKPSRLQSDDCVESIDRIDSNDKSLNGERGTLKTISDFSALCSQTAECQTSLCYDTSNATSIGVQISLSQHKDPIRKSINKDKHSELIQKSSVTTDQVAFSDISNESMFFVSQESEEDDDPINVRLNDIKCREKDEKGKKPNNKKKKYLFSHITNSRSVENDDKGSTNIEDRLKDLETSVDEEQYPIENYYEQITCEKNESYKKANDTNELLEMISDFTDKTKCESAKKDKSGIIDSKRFSFAPQRQSIVFSREDLMNNISMAQAVLQKSRQDDSDISVEDYDLELKKSESNEVVKTLQFDESLSERDLKPSFKHSAIKKTAFGETSYMSETKSRVIPSYLKDVSDGIKELMLDLVKPVNDVLPFEVPLDNAIKKDSPTNSSKQIQTNLITSSQIDLTEELDPVSSHDIHRFVKSTSNDCSQSSKVIVFDHENPLNNVLLGPIQFSSAHEYQPISNEESTSDTHVQIENRDNYNRFVSRNYHVHVNTRISGMQGDAGSEVNNAITLSHDIDKVSSIDQSINADLRDVAVTDSEVNTLIAMKGNKELLECSSSLTLVDEPVMVEDLPPVFTVNSDLLSLSYKGHKRVYSPANKNPNSNLNLEITPKPSSKIQKVSTSPSCYREILDIHLSPELQKQDIKELCKRDKKKKTPNKNIPELTIQNLHTASNSNKDKLIEIFADVLGKPESSSSFGSCAFERMSSFSNSKSLVPSSCHIESTATSMTSQAWHPDFNSGSSKTDNEASGNVVAKIDMLNFMGSHECEWEPSSADRWCFKLLHGRIRLSVRLAHRLDNSTRSTVRGDTPVIETSVEAVHIDKNNAVAALCIQFSCDTMRLMLSSKPLSLATEVPSLLRRCAAVARVALKWGQAMHNAKLHLAFTLDNKGHLTLKVANIPLRSVWEVSMLVSLQRSGPCATEVRVRRVVSDVCVTHHDIDRLLENTPRDWGHVPRVVWSVFRYLKHKTRDDNMLLGAWPLTVK